MICSSEIKPGPTGQIFASWNSQTERVHIVLLFTVGKGRQTVLLSCASGLTTVTISRQVPLCSLMPGALFLPCFQQNVSDQVSAFKYQTEYFKVRAQGLFHPESCRKLPSQQSAGSCSWCSCRLRPLEFVESVGMQGIWMGSGHGNSRVAGRSPRGAGGFHILTTADAE